ncbi:MAG: hypothetical protein CM15mP49_16120 [Actinomycetota bacterium]|nr:MAG: hypothetical protein CM15mP49_16120 [Actinomycetota bacterium]
MIVNGNNFGNFKHFTPNNRLANKLVSENLKAIHYPQRFELWLLGL